MTRVQPRQKTTLNDVHHTQGTADGGPRAAQIESALTDIVRLRVRYDESDQMGITYHARYLDWFVIGRTEWLRSIGLPYARLEEAGLLLPVLRVQCDYKASTKYDDIIELETTVTRLTRTRVRFRYAVRRIVEDRPRRANKQQFIASGETEHAFVGRNHRPVDVRKHFPRIWELLAPYGASLNENER